MSNQRNHFRLEYPKSERPKLRIDKAEYEILDLSEKGIKFESGGRFKQPPKSLVKGLVVFKDGKSCEIIGTVLRHITEKGHCVLSLTQGVPLGKMMEEQRTLLQKYNRQ